jgi:hypothetical protein
MELWGWLGGWNKRMNGIRGMAGMGENGREIIGKIRDHTCF